MRILFMSKRTLARTLLTVLIASLMLQPLAGKALARTELATYRSIGMLPGSLSSAFRFAVASDSHVGYGPANEKTAAALRDMVQRHPELAFMVHMGDLVETGSDAEYRLVKGMTAALPFPVMATPGNHEARWQDPQGTAFRGYFGSPNTSFNYGAWHFVVLDTTYPGETLGTLDPAALEWLEADLSANPGRPIAVFSHHPLLYGERQFQDSDDAFVRILDKYPVRAVFSGHGHSFITWRAQGLKFQMVGALMDGAYALVGVDKTTMAVTSVAPGPDGKMAETLLWQSDARPLSKAGSASGNPVVSLSAAAEDGRLDARVELGRSALLSFQIDDGGYNGLGSLGESAHDLSLLISGHAKGTHTLRVKATTEDGSYFASAEFRKDAADLALWERDLGSAVVGDILKKDSDQVIVGTRDGWVRSVRVSDGKILWEHDAGSQWGGGCLDGERLYFGTAAGNLDCLSARDGSLSWQLELDESGFASAPALAVTPAGKLIIAGSAAGRLHAVSAFHGGHVWQFQAKGAIQSSPAISANGVFFGAWDGSVYALDASSGSIKWSTPLGRQVYYSPYLTPAVSGGKLFATTPYDAKAGGSLLCALDVSTGRVLWKVPSKSTLMSPWASPGSPVTIADASGSIRAFSQNDGTLMWSKAASSTLFAGPPGNGPLYVSGGYRGVLSFLMPEGRADYVARDSFIFVSPLLVSVQGDDPKTIVLVADTRGRLSALVFPR